MLAVEDMDQMNDYEQYKMRRAGNITHSRTHAHTPPPIPMAPMYASPP